MRKIYGLLIFVILITAIFIRFNLLDKHFSHVDDLIPSQIYQLLYSDTGKLDNISTKFNIGSKNLYLNKAINPIIYAGYVAYTSTYAPLQFLITYFFINNNFDYKDILFWSRIPSFLFSIFSFLVLYHIFKKHFKSEYYTFLIGLILLSFSWEFIIYSVQAETYAIGVFAYLVCFLLYFKLVKNINELNLFTAFKYGVTYSLLILMQYQVIFVLPGMFFLLLIAHRENFKKNYRKYFCIVLPTFITMITLYYLLLSKLSSAGVTSNAGPNFEFLYNINGLDFFDTIIYTINFFLNNILITFNALVSFGDDLFFLNKTISIFYLICLILGLFSMFFSNSKVKKYFAYLTIISAFVFIFLIIKGKLTLSPTRHSLVYLSFIVLIIPEGFLTILNWLKLQKINYYNYLITVFCLLVFSIFIFQYSKIKNSRIDKFNTLEITELVNKYKVSNIYSINWTWNLLFMNSIKNNYKHEFNKNRSSLHFYKSISKEESNHILLISQREVDSSAIFNDFFAKNIDFSKFSLLYKKEQKSSTEVCHSNLTKNGTNGLYIYIYGVK